MGQLWSKMDAPSTSNVKKISNHLRRRPQPHKTSYVKKILSRRKASKRRPTISSPHQANPMFLNGHKWRHVIITMPSKDQPPLPPQRRKRQTKPSTCLVLQETSSKMSLPVQGNLKFEHYMRLFQSLIAVGLATHLPILRNVRSDHSACCFEDNSSLSPQSEKKAIVELLWHPTTASHRVELDNQKWSQLRFTVIRRKRKNQPDNVFAANHIEPINLPESVPTHTKFWLKFVQRMRPKRMGAGQTMRSLVKKANPLRCLLKQKSLSSQKNKDSETDTNIFDFYRSVAPFDPFTSQHLDPADDSEGSISDSLSEFSCSL